MEALLYSQGLEGPLEQEDKSIGTSIEKEVSILTAEQKETQAEIKKKAYSVLILSLGGVKVEVCGRNLEKIGRLVPQEDSFELIISQGQVFLF